MFCSKIGERIMISMTQVCAMYIVCWNVILYLHFAIQEFDWSDSIQKQIHGIWNVNFKGGGLFNKIVTLWFICYSINNNNKTIPYSYISSQDINNKCILIILV